MSLASTRSTASLPSSDGSALSDSMHRIVSDYESDGDGGGILPPRRALGTYTFPPIKTNDDVEVEPSLPTPKAPTVAMLSTPRATSTSLAPEVSPISGNTSPPQPLPASSSMTTLNRRSPHLHHRASLIIQDDITPATPGESPPNGMATGQLTPLRPGSPTAEPKGRHLSTALPSYLKIPTIIPTSYASPSASPPRGNELQVDHAPTTEPAEAPTPSEFPPRVVYSDHKQAEKLAASLKEVKAHDIPKPFLAPVSLSWHGRGRRVYVTGTFAHEWRSKIPLRQTRTGGPFVCTLYLPPGTHRLKFIVDNRWRVSNELNTASDGDGNMVNYVEIPNLLLPARTSSGDGAEATETSPDPAWAQAMDDLHKQQQNIHAQPRGDWEDMLGDDLISSSEDNWTSEVPASVELAQETEEVLHDNELGRDAQALLPVPPMMPPQLEKVILNSSPANISGSISSPSTVVDDTSVLPAPNHAVLNHLAASAIKNGVLAVGSVQRYKRKVRCSANQYVTTLLYRPVHP